jgi:hypothetical protein
MGDVLVSGDSGDENGLVWLTEYADNADLHEDSGGVRTDHRHGFPWIDPEGHGAVVVGTLDRGDREGCRAGGPGSSTRLTQSATLMCRLAAG